MTTTMLSPTITLSPGIENIMQTAANIVADTSDIIDRRGIDPQKVIYIAGEDHYIMSHIIFEMGLCNAILDQYGDNRIFFESEDKSFLASVEKSIRKKSCAWDWERVLLNQTLKHSDYAYMPKIIPGLAYSNDLDVHAIDLPVIFHPETIEIQPLPEKILERFETNSYYRAIRDQYPDILNSHGHNYEDDTWIIARDLFMTENICDITKSLTKNPDYDFATPSQLNIGRVHVHGRSTNPGYNILSLLTENGFFVVPILLSDQNEYPSQEKQDNDMIWKNFRNNLTQKKQDHIIKDYIIETSDKSIRNIFDNSVAVYDSLQHHLSLQP